ncbi:hypothetical protein JR316_0007039 [Psilocybe cubensis]|uniref:Transmembrane protein n=2 Tax=Psilocybe cubensis TaxID=181762 RepID=A0A8H7XZ52_PSICU|nr:hypothetical protein JR316_0007039 [Psilocybe cubensis]KAH9480439.1 hypothetical protein JR316_0007039 [Psilocybe cubensis]
MPSFRIPAFFRPRHSFNRLRSFHLSPDQVSGLATTQAPVGGTITPELKQNSNGIVEKMRTTSIKSKRSIALAPRPSNLSIPLRGSTIVKLAVVTSLFFIMSISMAFLGADQDEPFFKRTLNDVATNSPGVVLVGESVDVDIDEPSITIRWSIVACGEAFMLPGTAGAHGSGSCGLPASPIHFFVDSDIAPTATYDPTTIPFNKDTGLRRSIQNLVQFDSDHVLDVHEARLYPFDNYVLSSTIRAASFDNQTIPIQKIATIDVTSSFDILTIDVESFSTTGNGAQQVSRDIDMHVSRPNGARFFTLLLFAISWLLTHVTIGHVMVARRLFGMRNILPHLVSSGAILIAIPQLRNSMPDAPGLDDCIGFFPQMIIVSISTIILLLILVVREMDNMSHPPPRPAPVVFPPRPPPTVFPPIPRSPSVQTQFSRPPRSPTANSSSKEISQWEMHRMLKHLKGEFVFPPVKPSHRIQPSDKSSPSHRRIKTMSKIMEAGEVSHWSEDE